MNKKKKVGGVIIMHPNHNNYGTSLQGFATVKVIENLDYDLRIIRYVKQRSIKELINTIPGLIRSGALKNFFHDYMKRYDRFLHKDYFENNKIRTNVVNAFKKKYFDNISDFYYGFHDLHEGSKNYDVIFVGSDQVWGPLSLYARFYNLLFVSDSVPRFSYASSFGVSDILPWQKEGTKKYLDRLNLIGVRELRGKEMVENLSKNKAYVVADPTMLLSRDDWRKYTCQSKIKIKEPYILCYVLGERLDVRNDIKELAKKLNLKIVSLPHVDQYIKVDNNFGDIQIWNADALDFVNLIDNAAYVCTDSFHGTVFSILMHKKFLTYYRQQPTEKRSTHARINSLLTIFGLSDRIFKSDSLSQITQDIDYIKVDRTLGELRQQSLDFLKKGLNL